MKNLFYSVVLMIGVTSVMAAPNVTTAPKVSTEIVNINPVNAQKYTNCSCSGCQVGKNNQCYDKNGNAIPSSN